MRTVERRRTAPLIKDTAIKGNFTAKRAVEVAISGEHSITFYGPKGSGKTMFAEFLKRVAPEIETHEKRLCPCTYMGHPTIQCTCSVGNVKRYRARKPYQLALNSDILIECVFPREKEFDRAVWRFLYKGFRLAGLLPFYPGDDSAVQLLQAFRKHYDMDMHIRKRVLKVACTIARMDGRYSLRSQDIAEAAQYQAVENFR